MQDTDNRKSVSAIMRAVLDNNWLYVACIELWGIYVHLPFPHLPTYMYLPALFALCYMVFFAIEWIRSKRRSEDGGKIKNRSEGRSENKSEGRIKNRSEGRSENRGEGRSGAAEGGADNVFGAEDEWEIVQRNTYTPEPERKVTRAEFLDGLARVMTSKSSYLIAAVCAIPPYWLAEYYYGRYSFGIVVNGIVMLISFATVFAFLAYRKAKKM